MLKVLFVSALIFGGVSVAHAESSARISSSSNAIVVGDTFTADIVVDAQHSLDYGETLIIKYPSELVSVYSASYAAPWMPLVKEAEDDKKGTLKLMAVYPGGFTGEEPFATVVFLSKKASGGTITIGQGSFSSESLGEVSIPHASMTFMASAPFVSSGTSETIRKEAADRILAQNSNEAILGQGIRFETASAISSGVLGNARLIMISVTLLSIVTILFLSLPTPLKRHRNRRIFGKRG